MNARYRKIDVLMVVPFGNDLGFGVKREFALYLRCKAFDFLAEIFFTLIVLNLFGDRMREESIQNVQNT